MEWLQSVLSGESGSAIQLILVALGLVLLLVAIFWLFRKITGASAPKSSRNRVPRLSVTDSTRVDENRYLVLVRRDNVEHLVMIGGPSDVVIETSITRVASGAPAAPSLAATKPVEAKKEPSATAEPKQQPETTPNLEPKPAIAAATAVAGVVAANAASAQTSTETEAEPAATEPANSSTEIAVGTSLPEISDTAEPDSAAESATTIASVEPELSPDVELDLEATISEQLDDVLAVEEITIDENDVEPVVLETPENEESSASPEVGSEVDPAEKREDIGDKDDMQRLLDELAGIKQPAQ